MVSANVIWITSRYVGDREKEREIGRGAIHREKEGEADWHTDRQREQTDILIDGETGRRRQET